VPAEMSVQNPEIPRNEHIPSECAAAAIYLVVVGPGEPPAQAAGHKDASDLVRPLGPDKKGTVRERAYLGGHFPAGCRNEKAAPLERPGSCFRARSGGPSHTRASCFLCVAVRRQHAVISLEHWERSGQGVLSALWYLIIEPFRITGTCS
jgi:hypothetical protein